MRKSDIARLERNSHKYPAPSKVVIKNGKDKYLAKWWTNGRIYYYLNDTNKIQFISRVVWERIAKYS